MRRPGYRGRLAILVTTVVGVNVGYTAVLPHLPVIGRDLGLDATTLGAFFSGFAVAKALAQAPGGRAVDRLGGAVVTAIALLVAAGGIVVVALAGGGIAAVTGRLIWGFADGLASPALYYSASVLARTYGRDPAAAYAKLGAAAVGSFALGPILVGLLHTVLGWRQILLLAAALTVVNAVVAGLTAPGRAVTAEPEDRGERAGGPAPRWLGVVLIFGALDLCANILWSGIEPLVPLAMADGTHDTTGPAALVLAVGMGVFVVATMTLTKLPAAWRGPGWGAATMALLGLSCVGLTWVSTLWAGLLAIAVFMVAQGQIYLVARDGLTAYAGGTGRAWGVFGLMSDIGFILGPIIGIALFTFAGDVAFALLAQVALAAALVFAIVFRRLGPPALRAAGQGAERGAATTTTG